MDLAEAYYGLIPWNVYADEKELDKMLMKGVRRPRSAKVLKRKECKQYRMEKGWEAP